MMRYPLDTTVACADGRHGACYYPHGRGPGKCICACHNLDESDRPVADKKPCPVDRCPHAYASSEAMREHLRQKHPGFNPEVADNGG
jgi:hypothetical protein